MIPLIQFTFAERRKSVCGILETYPELNRPTLVWLYVVCYFILWSFIQIETEMGLIVNDNSIRNSCQKRWLEFLPTILHYGQGESKKEERHEKCIV